MGLLREHADQIAGKEGSSVELVDAAVRAAERLQPSLNAFTQIWADEALEDARRADAAGSGDPRPLRGVPVVVKDLYDVAGYVTSGCSNAYRDAPPAAADSPAVWALRQAGAILIGKANMHELAFGATNTISSYGPANNPWDAERMPGGSSGGSAAIVAARIVGLALGTDTGGSIRIPSSFCGATGLKTTWGMLTTYGVLPMSPSLDSVGPIATDADDCALAFDVLSGGAGAGPAPVERLRVGIGRDPYCDAVDTEVAAAVEELGRSLAGTTAHVRDVAVPWVSGADDVWLTIALAEFGREHRALADTPDALDPMTDVILRAGIATSGEDEHRARERAVEARAAFEAAMREVDVLLFPATPCPAPRHSDQTVVCGGEELPVHLGGPSRFTRPISVVGGAAVAMPIGFSSTGLPLGGQIVGRRGTERTLLAVAGAYQRESDWHTRVPPLCA